MLTMSLLSAPSQATCCCPTPPTRLSTCDVSTHTAVPPLSVADAPRSTSGTEWSQNRYKSPPSACFYTHHHHLASISTLLLLLMVLFVSSSLTGSIYTPACLQIQLNSCQISTRNFRQTSDQEDFKYFHCNGGGGGGGVNWGPAIKCYALPSKSSTRRNFDRKV